MKTLLLQFKKLFALSAKSSWAKGNYYQTGFAQVEGGLIMSSASFELPNPCEKCKNYTPVEPKKEISGSPI